MNPVYDLVAQYVEGLTPSGEHNYRGRCPLHQEEEGTKRPGFSVNIENGLWYCFRGCGGGPLPLLLARLKMPASQVRQTVERLAPFLAAPKQPAPHVPRELGVTPQPLPEWILGLYCVEPTPLVEAGFDPELLFQHDVGVDLPRARITFPIRDAQGTLAGISGRDLTGEDPNKYRVYEREIQSLQFPDYRFHNRDFLYRMDRVFPAAMAQRNPTIIVCEGFKATLWVAQAGFPMVVGLMGATPTAQQCWLLERMGGQILSFLDNDEAGRKGTTVLRQKVRGVQHRTVLYPPDVHQPDDIPTSSLRALITGSTRNHTG